MTDLNLNMNGMVVASAVSTVDKVMVQLDYQGICVLIGTDKLAPGTAP